MGDNWAWHTSPWYNSSVVGSPVSTPILTVTTTLFSSAIIAYFYLAKESWTCTVKFYINWGRRRQQHIIGKMNIFLDILQLLQILREFLSNIFVPALTMRGWIYLLYLPSPQYSSAIIAYNVMAMHCYTLYIIGERWFKILFIQTVMNSFRKIIQPVLFLNETKLKIYFSISFFWKCESWRIKPLIA